MTLTARRIRDFWFAKSSTLPIFFQGSSGECGLACLAMVFSAFGKRTTIGELRQKFPISIRGAYLKELLQAANDSGFVTRAVQAPLEDLPDLQLPAILHWDLDHFVVLRKIDKRKAYIHDPATGLRILPLNVVSKHYTGIAVEMRPGENFAASRGSGRLKLSRLLSNTVGIKRFLSQVLVVALVAQILATISPLYLQFVIDEAAVGKDLPFLNVLMISFMIIAIVRFVLGWVRSATVNYLGHIISLQLQGNLLQHLLRLPLSFFVSRDVGDITSRLNSSVALQGPIVSGATTGVVDGLMFFFALGMMLVYSGTLTLVACVLVATYLLIRLMRLRMEREVSAENLVHLAESNRHVLETIRTIRSIKGFGLETERLGGWQNSYFEAVSSGIRLARLRVGFDVFARALALFGYILVAYFGAQLVMEEVFTIGMLVAFLSYYAQFNSATTRLIDLGSSLRLLRVHLDRISDIADGAPEETGSGELLEFDGADLGLEVVNVSYRYGVGEPWVVAETSIAIEPGKWTVIVGQSGSGKSTLVNIMLGLAQPEEGVVRFANTDIRTIGLSNYRRRVAAVTPDDRLFLGTLGQNITSFATEPDKARMLECARLSQIDGVIAKMPLRYQTKIGDMGDSLSAGERQRLMLARALYKDPDILFLDEATSNLDLDLERRVYDVLAATDMTLLVVTHRKTPLRYADRVFEMIEGKLQPLDLNQARMGSVQIY